LTELDALNEQERDKQDEDERVPKGGHPETLGLASEGTGSPTALQNYPLLFFLDRTS
jgi:hypothetical protein